MNVPGKRVTGEREEGQVEDEGRLGSNWGKDLAASWRRLDPEKAGPQETIEERLWVGKKTHGG